MPKLSAKKKFEKHQSLLKKRRMDPITLYLESLSPGSRRPMRCLLQRAARMLAFKEQLEKVPWHMLEYQHVLQIRMDMLAEQKSLNTVNLMISAINGVMTACFDLGLLSADELMRIKKVKLVRGRNASKGIALTEVEIKKLLSACSRKRSLVAKRNLCIIVVLISTGLRRSELCDLKLADYDAEASELTVRNGKGRKARIAYLTSSASRYLNRWVRLRGYENGPLFPKIDIATLTSDSLEGHHVYKIVRDSAEQASIKNLSPHDLRRTFITMLLERGVDINSVRQLAGHSGIQTTALYDHRNESFRKKAIKVLADVL
jgi:integrase/recombinase XerD